MARYDTEHKAQTRRRIIETAGRRVKQDGIDGSGVAALMADAGLTNGAFYAHFESKDDLVANVVADQLATQRAVLAVATRGQGGAGGSSSVSTCPRSIATIPAMAVPTPRFSTRSAAAATPFAIPTPGECNPSSR